MTTAQRTTYYPQTHAQARAQHAHAYRHTPLTGPLIDASVDGWLQRGMRTHFFYSPRVTAIQPLRYSLCGCAAAEQAVTRHSIHPPSHPCQHLFYQQNTVLNIIPFWNGNHSQELTPANQYPALPPNRVFQFRRRPRRARSFRPCSLFLHPRLLFTADWRSGRQR